MKPNKLNSTHILIRLKLPTHFLLLIQPLNHLALACTHETYCSQKYMDILRNGVDLAATTAAFQPRSLSAESGQRVEQTSRVFCFTRRLHKGNK